MHFRLNKHFFPFLIVLFWLAGANFCFLEKYGYRSDSSSNECPSHAGDSGKKGREGPCTVTQLRVQGVSLLLETASVNDFLSQHAAIAIEPRINESIASHQFDSSSVPISLPLLANTIFSNGPPPFA